MIDQPSAAILIDCWESINNKWTENVLNNIINFLDSNDHIRTVILATYEAATEDPGNISKWHRTYGGLFHLPGNTYSSKIQFLHMVHNKYDREFSPTNMRTHPMIWNYVHDQKTQIKMHWMWELEYYLSVNTDIKNIYVMGHSWDICVGNRPLGFESLAELPDINILARTDCTRLSHWPEDNILGSEYPDLSIDPDWQPVYNNVYVYRPTTTKHSLFKNPTRNP